MTLTEQVTGRERTVRRLSAIVANLATAAKIADVLRQTKDLPRSVPLKRLLSSIDRIEAEASKRTNVAREAEITMRQLSRRGLGDDDFYEVYSSVFGSTARSNTVSAEAFGTRIKDAIAEAEKSESKVAADVAASDAKRRPLRKAVSELLSGYGSGNNHGARQVMLRKDLRSLKAVQLSIESMRKVCEVKPSARLADVAAQIARSYSLSKEMAASSADERVRRESLSSTSRRFADHESNLAVLAPRLARAREANSLLSTVIHRQSIETVFSSFVNENHSRISSILADIHAPREFVGIERWTGRGGIRLIRDDKAGTRADLTKVSTGQRSAIALSIFLTLNEQLRNAPPLVMLDDPVAHVDDMNMLAFVDYLREIAISGGRQLFFASANQKVTAIFQQKFAAFKSDFRVISLSR